MMMNKPREFHQALARAVKQTTNQSQPSNVSVNASSPEIQGRSTDANKLIMWGEREMSSNETELSHRWRERALPQSLMLKSYEKYSSERPTVGWSDWLGLNPKSICDSLHGKVDRNLQYVEDARFEAPLPKRVNSCLIQEHVTGALEDGHR
jgi:hypothetical protein